MKKLSLIATFCCIIHLAFTQPKIEMVCGGCNMPDYEWENYNFRPYEMNGQFYLVVNNRTRLLRTEGKKDGNIFLNNFNDYFTRFNQTVATPNFIYYVETTQDYYYIDRMEIRNGKVDRIMDGYKNDLLRLGRDNDNYASKISLSAYENGITVEYYQIDRKSYASRVVAYQILDKQMMAEFINGTNGKNNFGDYPYWMSGENVFVPSADMDLIVTGPKMKEYADGQTKKTLSFLKVFHLQKGLRFKDFFETLDERQYFTLSTPENNTTLVAEYFADLGKLTFVDTLPFKYEYIGKLENEIFIMSGKHIYKYNASERELKNIYTLRDESEFVHIAPTYRRLIRRGDYLFYGEQFKGQSEIQYFSIHIPTGKTRTMYPNIGTETRNYGLLILGDYQYYISPATQTQYSLNRYNYVTNSPSEQVVLPKENTKDPDVLVKNINGTENFIAVTSSQIFSPKKKKQAPEIRQGIFVITK